MTPRSLELPDHNDKINKLIHLVCVWPILWTALALMARLGPIAPMPSAALKVLPFGEDAWSLHPGAVFVGIYVTVYLGKAYGGASSHAHLAERCNEPQRHPRISTSRVSLLCGGPL